MNPFTEQLINEFELLTDEEINREIEKSRRSFLTWKKLSVSQRVSPVKKLGEILRAEKQKYAETMTREMGKPIRESLAEIEKCAWLCDYFAENARKFLKPERVKTEFAKSYVVFEPLGIVLAIMPWNFPFWQVFRFGIPAIAAGNCCLLKHASNVPLSALSIEEAFREAGFPENVLKTLIIDASAAMKIIDEDKVDAVSLTGSEKAGEQVGSLAGKQLKKVVLELGGSDPFIVLDDADVQRAGRMGARARMINTGQSCIAAKRFIVMEKVAEEFKDAFIGQLREFKIGDPMDENTDIGPVAKKEILDGLNAQLQDVKNKGGEVIQVGHSPEKGLFFSPCAVLNPGKGMKILTEEVFGPIAPIITVKTEAAAVKTANSTRFGLGASVWSKNLKRAEKIARKLESGVVVINDMVKSDPRLPFGGTKKSGIGRELSHYGLKEFVNIKTIVVRE